MDLLIPEPFLIILSFLGIIMLILWIVALIGIIKNDFQGQNEKLIWAILVIFVPFIGSILYFTIGRKRIIKTL